MKSKFLTTIFVVGIILVIISNFCFSVAYNIKEAENINLKDRITSSEAYAADTEKEIKEISLAYNDIYMYNLTLLNMYREAIKREQEWLNQRNEACKQLDALEKETGKKAKELIK